MEIERHVYRDGLERLAMFIDFHNLEGSLRNEGIQVDILALRDYLTEGRTLLEAFVYVGFNPNTQNGDHQFHRFLKMNGFLVKTKPAKVRPDGSLKCDFDIELAIDVIDYVSLVKPAIVLLVTGDGDFAPLATWLRQRGTRVEVASTPTSISQDLRGAANGYIDLCEATKEIQRAGGEIAAQKEEVITHGNGNNQREADRDSLHGDG